MKDGFIKVAAASPEVRVADCDLNAERIIELIKQAAEKGVKVVCFPELCITGYTCGDLFGQELLINSAMSALMKIKDDTKSLDIISIVGLPVFSSGKLYNAAAVLYHGEIMGITAKQNIPNYGEFYEQRYFSGDNGFRSETYDFAGERITADERIIFTCKNMRDFSFGVEICEDLWVAGSPSETLARNGAAIIFNLSASDEIIGKADYRRTLIKAKSGTLTAAYVYSDAGIGESTQDMVFSGHCIIAENGSVIAEKKPFTGEKLLIADIDVKKLAAERRRISTFTNDYDIDTQEYTFEMPLTECSLERPFPKAPFVPSDKKHRYERCEEILTMQAVGLMSRLKAINCKNTVIGLSGGLDSTLALIVTVHAYDMLGLDRSGIHAITMPCFGTTDRTYTNACKLAKAYGAELEEINIKKSVLQHFEDISHDPEKCDVTYENSQARERTQILMDKANQCNGLVVGTGDLSELALGWATYNGDHMSMYGVNASIPKTLVRYLVDHEAQNAEGELSAVLYDVLDTPVSPELLPPEKDGTIKQKTEDLVGPYELHDYFLYYAVRFGFAPSKIFRMAVQSFEGSYTPETILKWLRTFFRRFFTQQFKRSCLPDGPKVGSVTLSPRGDWRMPSDASAALWLKEIDEIEKTL